MIRVLLLLIGGLMTSALMLVTSQYHARSYYVAIERERSAARSLEMQWRQLQIDQTEYARHAHVEKVGREQIGLVPTRPDRTLFLTPAGVEAPGEP